MLQRVLALGDDSTVYAGGDGIYAFTPAGNLRCHFEAGVGRLMSSPVIGADGTSYATDQSGELVAFGPDTAVRWRCRLDAEGGTAPPALGADGRIYCVDGDGTLYAVRSDGTLGWRIRLDSTSSVEPCAPSIGPDGTIYCACANLLHAVAPDGRLRWGYACYSLITSTPAVAEDGTVLVGTWDGYLVALTPGGSVKWQYGVPGWVTSSPVIGPDGSIIFGTTDGLYVLQGTASLARSPWPMFQHDPGHSGREAGE
jgi:outer membrane protein assembly factor BamB